MLKKTASLAICLSMLLVYASGCTITIPEETEVTSNDTEKVMTRSDYEPIRAQDDFYGYVNLEDLKSYELDYDNQSMGAFSNVDVSAQLLDSLKRIVNSGEDYPEGSCEQIILKAYNQYVNYLTDDEAKKLANEDADLMLKRITEITTLDDVKNLSVELQRDYGVHTLNVIGVDGDIFNPDEYAVISSALYDICGVNFEDVNKNARNAEKYEAFIEQALRVSGMSQNDAENITREFMYKIIAIAWETNIEALNSANPYLSMQFITTDDLDSMLVNNKTSDYLSMNGITTNPYGGIIVQDLDQFIAIDAFFCEENVEYIKAWMIYSFVSTFTEELSLSHSELSYYVSESTEEIERQALQYIMDNYFMELSELYTKDYYTEEMDNALNSMCEDIIFGYENVIGNATWLSQEGRELLLTKLHNIQFITGGYVLNHLTDFSYENDLFGANIYDTYKNRNNYRYNEMINSIGKPHDKMKLSMMMYDFNACYTQDNVVNITVAIMQTPFFDASASRFTNLGGLGAVVGHEIGHGFDSNCLSFDYNGVLNPSWLPSSDNEALLSRNEEAIEYFESSFSVFDVYYVDGEQTLGENYADLGSLEVITSLCEKDSDYVELFENYARIWCNLSTEENVIYQIAHDVHSPSTIRVNAILATLDVFYEIYDVQEGDGMYIAPENRIGRWN